MTIDDDDVIGEITVGGQVCLVVLTPTLIKDGIRVIDASDLTDVRYVITIPEPMWERVAELGATESLQDAITEVVTGLIDQDE